MDNTTIIRIACAVLAVVIVFVLIQRRRTKVK
jgi:preprotein translocase subunit SecG